MDTTVAGYVFTVVLWTGCMYCVYNSIWTVYTINNEQSMYCEGMYCEGMYCVFVANRHGTNIDW